MILCCDREMVSEENLKRLRDAGMPYVVATKLRRDKAAQAVLAQPGHYHVVSGNLEVKEVTLSDAADRYIVCRNPDAVETDRQEREAIVAALEARLASGTVRSLLRGAARRYVRAKGGHVTLDRVKIDEEARYDGKWVLRTNSDLPTADAAQAYKGL
jgi:hypothetical protein